MNRTYKINLRLKVSLSWSLVTAIIVFLGSYTLLLIVKEKRLTDLKRHSASLAEKIQHLPSIRAFFMEHPDAPTREEVESILNILIQDDPFIEAIILSDQFNQNSFHISQAQTEQPANSTFSLLKIHEVMTEKKPLLLESQSEYIIPISFDQENFTPWVHVWIRWKQEATWKYFRLLKWIILLVTAISFMLAFMISLLLLKQSYTFEYKRLNKSLAAICGTDYSRQIDTKSYSSGIAEIAVYLNRIFKELNHEKRKNKILEDSLRQMERGCLDYRKALGVKTNELDVLRNELRQGLVRLFDMIWNGVAIIDSEYYIHFMNDQAERLLRFARIDDSHLVDERLRSCLSPLIRLGQVDQIDDVCVWPQQALGQFVSCNIRAAQIPSGDTTRLFFILLKEENGYPKQHGAAYFSERLVVDILSNISLSANEVDWGSVQSNISAAEREMRFKECLKRLEAFHKLENNDYGPVSVIRLSKWLKNHFVDSDDLFSRYLHLDANTPDLDVSLQVPEKVLNEHIDSMVLLLTRLVYEKESKPSKYMVLRASVDSKGKPVITISMPSLSRKLASKIHDILNERQPIVSEDKLNQGLTLEDLDLEISYSLYRYTKQLLKTVVECVYSENKQLAMLRITIENHAFVAPKKPSSDTNPVQPSQTISMIQEILGRF